MAAPKVWNSFEGKRKNGATVKLRVQDVPEERMEEAFQFTNTYLLSEEVIYKASGLYKSEEGMKEYVEIITAANEYNPPKMMICCVDDGSKNGGEIAGTSIVSLDKDTDSLKDLVEKFEVKSPELRNLIKAGIALEEEDLFRKYKTHYHGKGIVVHPNFRGMGIANEFVRLRGIICKENDVPMTAAWMTAKGSQRAAENNNWKTYTELLPEVIAEKSGLVFEKDAIPFKLMYITKEEVK
ncbi:uncharacterized protein LOC121732473 [Aricia agestis]|uniref:uncharacterized protein LOC121732473 n=1 Tax=Aricia agestis TaxID=91739 RepID=UPI001C207D45|nr:uncharacterized protein LOC121732473 [Aricia agestis]